MKNRFSLVVAVLLALKLHLLACLVKESTHDLAARSVYGMTFIFERLFAGNTAAA